MKKFYFVILLTLLLVMGFSTIVSQAQDDCSLKVSQILTFAKNFCDGTTGVNQICIGNNKVSALLKTSVDFSNPGDIVGINDIGPMTITAMDPTTYDWGVAIMHLLADVGGINAFNTATVGLYGDVSVDSISTANILNIQFSSGATKANCTGAPEPGMLIFVPQGGLGHVPFIINGVEISVESIVFLQATRGGTLTVSVINGGATVAALGQTISLAIGQSVDVPMSPALQPSAIPGIVATIDGQKLIGLLPIMSDLQTYTVGSGGAVDLNNPTQPQNSQDTTPCTISTTDRDTFGVRVGPGENRSRIAWLEPGEYTVTGKNTENGLWWQLVKEEAAPKKAANINEAWVQDKAGLTKIGGCEFVADAAAPRIIRAPKPTTPDTDNSNPPPPDGSTDEYVNFYASPETIKPGECTTIYWDVRNIREVYYRDVGVIGQDSAVECPTEYTDYELRVISKDGEIKDYYVYVDVNIHAETCQPSDLPYQRYSYTSSGSGGESWYINLDPCQLPARLIVEMLATGSSTIDSYMEVYIDGVYFADSYSGVDELLYLDIPAGARQMMIKAYADNNTSGDYEIFVDYE